MVRFGTEQSKKCTHVWPYISAIKAGGGGGIRESKGTLLKLSLPRIHLLDNLVHSCKTNRNDSDRDDNDNLLASWAGIYSCHRRLLKNFSHSNIRAKEDHEYEGS